MLEGKIKLDFCDAITGKTKERIEGHNSFTDAINSLLNKAPCGCDRAWLDGSVVSSEKILNFTETALGGVLIFPEETGSGLYEPLSHQPVAYSRFGARDTTDRKTGTFNSVDSKAIDGGYRFVHEWGASYGNGTIKTVCLTNIYGAEAYGQKAFFGDKWYYNLPRYEGIKPLGFHGGFYYFIDVKSNFSTGANIKRLRRPLNEMIVNQQEMAPINAETIYTSTATGSRVGLDETTGKIYIISAGSTSTERNLTTIDLTTTPIGITTTTMTVPRADVFPTRTTGYFFIAVKSGYLYSVNSYNTSTGEINVGKINISNNADYREITGTIAKTVSDCDIYTMTDTGEINGGAFIIDPEDELHPMTVPSGDTRLIMNRYGVWQAVKTQASTGQGPMSIGFQINPYYMATKYVLQSAATKDASLTMKLTYEVIHT